MRVIPRIASILRGEFASIRHGNQPKTTPSSKNDASFSPNDAPPILRIQPSPLWIMIFWHSSTIFCPVTSTIIIDQVTTISLLYSCLGGDVWISPLPLLVCSSEFFICLFVVLFFPWYFCYHCPCIGIHFFQWISQELARSLIMHQYSSHVLHKSEIITLIVLILLR